MPDTVGRQIVCNAPRKHCLIGAPVDCSREVLSTDRVSTGSNPWHAPGSCWLATDDAPLRHEQRCEGGCLVGLASRCRPARDGVTCWRRDSQRGAKQHEQVNPRCDQQGDDWGQVDAGGLARPSAMSAIAQRPLAPLARLPLRQRLDDGGAAKGGDFGNGDVCQVAYQDRAGAPSRGSRIGEGSTPCLLETSLDGARQQRVSSRCARGLLVCETASRVSAQLDRCRKRRS